MTKILSEETKNKLRENLKKAREARKAKKIANQPPNPIPSETPKPPEPTPPPEEKKGWYGGHEMGRTPTP